MAAEELRVYCAELAHAARATTRAADEIDGLRGRLGGRMNELAGTWTGRAASAYLDVWAEIDDECGQMLDDLRWIGESLAAAAAGYAQMEHTASDAFGGIRPAGAVDGR
ncbi:WXG100 family type VII secretion target [Mycobacterium attenuatum]|uniref:WXG100 family type VII secretion target n=1 Tax=Mycobacterium attenuatum TaxID=2341086 RepID=UPI000F1D3802|nr:WXG100 family type VII secretion target [Mycobacterium attenuatum]VBA47237.1 hypothetical protein LAUMK41_00519 [Mycobacterium attenuatum]